MKKIEVEKLKDLFTMEDKSIGEIVTDLEVAPFDVMNAIITFTANPQDFSKVDEFSKLIYVTKEAYRQGFLAALYQVNEVNKDVINALANDKDVLIANN